MQLWIWAIVAVILFLVEGLTVSLVSIWFGLGALAAFITAFFTEQLWIQLLVFCVISIVALLLTRPLAKRYLASKRIPTNVVDSILGRTCTIQQAITADSLTGQAKLDDILWIVVAQTPGELFSVDEQARIVAIQGNKLVLIKK